MKKYIVSILITSVFLIGTPFLVPKASAADVNIRDFVNLLVLIGVITPEKMIAVNAFLASLENPHDEISEVECTSFTYGSWSACTDGVKNRVASGSPAGCIGGHPVLSQVCNVVLKTYTVTYNSNSLSDEVPVPTDANKYVSGAPVTIPSSLLTRNDYAFVGWVNSPSGGGDILSPGSTFTIGSSDITLYAKWAPQTSFNCEKGDFAGKAGQLGMQYKPMNVFNDDKRFICDGSSHNFYYCTSDNEQVYINYWNTFSSRALNGQVAGKYQCDGMNWNLLD